MKKRTQKRFFLYTSKKSTIFALAFGKQVAMTDTRASLGDSYLRSPLKL